MRYCLLPSTLLLVIGPRAPTDDEWLELVGATGAAAPYRTLILVSLGGLPSDLQQRLLSDSQPDWVDHLEVEAFVPSARPIELPLFGSPVLAESIRDLFCSMTHHGPAVSIALRQCIDKLVRQLGYRRPNAESQHERALVWAWLGGSSVAFSELYRHYGPPLRERIRRRLPAARVDDVIQEAFLRLHAHRDQFDPTRPVWPWLGSIANNVAVSISRRQRRDDALRVLLLAEETSCSPTQETGVDASRALVRVTAALASLNPSDRYVVLEASAGTNKPLSGASRVRLHRCRQRLREAIDDHTVDPTH